MEDSPITKDRRLAILGEPLRIKALPEHRDNIEYLTTEIETLRRKLDHLPILEAIRDAVSLDCSHKLTKITIVKCRAYRDRGQCRSTRCIPRTTLIGRLS